MRDNPALFALATILLVAFAPLHAAPWGVEVYRDDFDGVELDPSSWIVNHPGHFWWVQGRSHYPDPGTTDGPFPYLADGACVVEHHLYNPYDLGAVNSTFLGGEIHSARQFDPASAASTDRVSC